MLILKGCSSPRWGNKGHNSSLDQDLSQTWSVFKHLTLFPEGTTTGECNTCQGRPSTGTFLPPMIRFVLSSCPSLLVWLSERTDSTFGEINPQSWAPRERLADAITKKITANIYWNWAENTRCFFKGPLLAEKSSEQWRPLLPQYLIFLLVKNSRNSTCWRAKLLR